MGSAVNTGNRGVLALGTSLVNLCMQASPESEVFYLLNNRDNQPVSIRFGETIRLIPVVHARLSPRCRPCDHFYWILLFSVLYRLLPFTWIRGAIIRSTPWIKTVHEADLVGDIRGGDGFSDIYGLKGLIRGLLSVWTVILIKGNIAYFPQTYGPFRSPFARWLARYFLNRSSVIFARDRQSLEVAQRMVGPAKNVLLSPDVAFSLQPVQPRSLELETPRSASSIDKVIGLNINGLMYNSGYSRKNMFGLKLDYVSFLSELIRSLLIEHTGTLWLIPHTFEPPGNIESDNDASRKLRDSLPEEFKNRVRMITREYDEQEIKWIIGQCEFFIGSRMHSCIAALSQGIPCVGVAYSKKFAGVFESVGMESWVIDARSTSQDEAVSRTLSLYCQRDDVRGKLLDHSEKAQRQLIGNFKTLINRNIPGVR